MRRTHLFILILAMALMASIPASAESVDAHTAFERLSSLAGTWRGEPDGHGEEAEAEAEMAGEVVHEIKLSAAGTVVMETMNPGTDHEMINMYHVDGDDLVVTHYCAGGNQPQMRLNRETSTAQKLVFDFAGGTNLDPGVDHYIRSAEISLVDEDHLTSMWTSYGAGKETGGMAFHLARSR